jgi:hypothetical protein
MIAKLRLPPISHWLATYAQDKRLESRMLQGVGVCPCRQGRRVEGIEEGIEDWMDTPV